MLLAVEPKLFWLKAEIPVTSNGRSAHTYIPYTNFWIEITFQVDVRSCKPSFIDRAKGSRTEDYSDSIVFLSESEDSHSTFYNEYTKHLVNSTTCLS